MAEFALELKFEDLPPEVVEEVKRYLYDSIGCAFGGYQDRDVKGMMDIYTDMGGKPEASLIGSGEKLPTANAALLNSLMVRALDYNDIYWKEDPSHPSDLIPAALAMGERQNSSMKEVIVAIVLAYEFDSRRGSRRPVVDDEKHRRSDGRPERRDSGAHGGKGLYRHPCDL